MFYGGSTLPFIANPRILSAMALHSVRNAFYPELIWYAQAAILAQLEKGDVPTEEHLRDPTAVVMPELLETRAIDRNDPDDWSRRILMSDYITRCMDQPPGPDDPEELFELLLESQNRTLVGDVDVMRMIECTGNFERPKNQFLGTFLRDLSMMVWMLIVSRSLWRQHELPYLVPQRLGRRNTEIWCYPEL